MKPSTLEMIKNFRQMNGKYDASARYNMACWLRDNRRCLKQIRTK